MAPKMIGFREPGFATRQQQREHAKLNVNHPANLPRIEMRRDEANKRDEVIIHDDVRFGDVLTLGKLQEAMKLMDPWGFVNRPLRRGELMPVWPARPNFQQIPRKVRRDPAEVEAVRHAAAVARDVAAFAIAPPVVMPTGPSYSEPERVAAIEMAGKIGKLTQALREAYATVIKGSTWQSNANMQPHANAIKEFMSDYGWKHVGSGHFSLAFVKGDLCIKVGLKSEDSGAAYAAFARDNPNLKGLPTIHDLQRHGKDSYTVVMPKYVPLNAQEKSDLNWGARRGVMERWGVVEAYDRILSFFAGMADIDMHGENVMKTEGGAYIITDPVSFIAGKKPVW